MWSSRNSFRCGWVSGSRRGPAPAGPLSRQADDSVRQHVRALDAANESLAMWARRACSSPRRWRSFGSSTPIGVDLVLETGQERRSGSLRQCDAVVLGVDSVSTDLGPQGPFGGGDGHGRASVLPPSTVLATGRRTGHSTRRDPFQHKALRCCGNGPQHNSDYVVLFYARCPWSQPPLPAPSWPPSAPRSEFSKPPSSWASRGPRGPPTAVTFAPGSTGALPTISTP